MPRPPRPEPAATTTGSDTAPPPLDLQQLRCFVAVADELNFTRAAARVGIVQSGLSHQIAQLERDQRVTLFERTSRTVRLAPPGRILLPLARTILTDLELAQTELAQLTGLLSGHLRIGSISGVHTGIEATVARFHRDHPAVTLTIDDTQPAGPLDQLISGEIDLAVVDLPGSQVPDQYTYYALSEEPLVAVAAGDSPIAATPTGRRVEPADLQQIGSAVDLPAQHGLRHRVDQLFSTTGGPQRHALEVATMDALLRYVGLGYGYGIAPLSAAIEASSRLRLIVRHLWDPTACYPIGLLHRSPAPAAPAARAFLAALSDAPPA